MSHRPSARRRSPDAEGSATGPGMARAGRRRSSRLSSLTGSARYLLWDHEAFDTLQHRRRARRRGAVLFHDHRTGEGRVPRVHGVPRTDQLRGGRGTNRAGRPRGGAKHRLRADRERDGPADRLFARPTGVSPVPTPVRIRGGEPLRGRRGGTASTSPFHGFPPRLSFTYLLHVFSISSCPTCRFPAPPSPRIRSEEHTSELQSHSDLVCRLLLEKKN